MEKKIKKITKMEKILNEQNDLLNKIEKLLDEFESKQDDFSELIKYYSSREWMQDHDLMIEGKIPQNVRCGVLTEDAVYNMLGDHLEKGKRLEEVANAIYKEHAENR